MFIAALFIVVRIWKQPHCSSTDKWIQMFYICVYTHTHTHIQFSSVARSCPTLCDPMNRSTPGLPIHHQLQEFTQTHVHRVGDAIQPSHPVIPFSSCPQSFTHTLLSYGKEWTFAICSNMNRLRGHYARWSKSDRERQIWSHLYVKSKNYNKLVNITTTKKDGDSCI